MKKLISLLLAVIMVFCLLPLSALAADSQPAEGTGREPGPKGDEDVAVMVYGKTVSDAVHKAGYNFTDFVAALKSELQGVLADETLPEVEVYLVNDQNQEYKLTKNAVEDAAFLSSFQFEADGLLGWADDVFKWLEDAFGWLISDIDTVGEFYDIYGAEDVPEGDYTLEIRKIDGDGYTLWAPEDGVTRVHVGDDHVNYVGYKKELGSYDFDIEYDFGIFEIDWDVFSVSFSMPGVFFDTREPGFTFRTADLGGNALPGAEFLLVNRDETEKIVRAAVALGKDTFTNAMNLIGTEGFTWEELSILNKELLTWDQQAQQITFNHKEAYKLLTTYWYLVEASAMDPLINFMSDETDIRLPAILKATSDENGYVFFGEDNNVTLTWSLEILLRMADVVLTEAEDIELVDGMFEDPQTESMVRLVLTLAKYAAEKGTEFWDENGQLVTDVINDWVYPILQNDNMMEFAKDAMIWVIGEDSLTEDDLKMLELLPTHALLTKKMPTGHYLMLEIGVPEGYVHNPMFYTINLTWNTESSDPGDWCYATVGNLGIIAPYFLEEYYGYLRGFNASAEADRILNLISGGRTGAMIQDMISDNTDVSALAIAYQANIIYNYMGGNQLYSSEQELAQELTKYLYAHGRTAQNLLIFSDRIAREAKGIVSAEITPEWTFYNFSTSLRTNIALNTQALIRGIAASIDTTGNAKLNTAVKDMLEKTADSIDTSNRIIEQTTQIQNQIKQTVKDVASGAAKAALSTAGKIVKSLLSWRV